MNPALSPQTTGFLPSRSTNAVTSSSTDGSVTTVRTISPRSCTGAGWKKCTPTTRPGWALAVEISVTDSEEVFVARIAVGETIVSSSRKIPFLISRDSTTASTTKSASARSFISVVSVIRPRISACSASVILPRFTARPVECSRCWRPRARASSLISTPTTARPVRAKTSAIPAPMVPSPTTPTVWSSRGESGDWGALLVMPGIVSRASSRAHRELVHWPVTNFAADFGRTPQLHPRRADEGPTGLLSQPGADRSPMPHVSPSRSQFPTLLTVASAVQVVAAVLVLGDLLPFVLLLVSALLTAWSAFRLQRRLLSLHGVAGFAEALSEGDLTGTLAADDTTPL